MNSLRREKIRQFVEEHNIATLQQLAELLPDVSLMTIHRDLSYLQEQGFLIKIRGGARYLANSTSEPAFSAREIVNRSAKLKAAEKAIPLLSGSGSIFIDSGTTMMAFAKMLPNIQGSMITTGPNIALECAKKPGLTVSLTGGILNPKNLILSGSSTLEALSGINIDTAFLVTSGYSVEAGFTCGLESEARTKKLVTAKARKTVMLMDSSKIGRMLPYTFGELQNYDYLVTDIDPDLLPQQLREQAKAGNVVLV